jgi:hypothetical protein
MTDSDNSQTSESYSGGGKLAVVAMIAVALVAATFAWWWNFNRGRKALAFFGPQAAHLIRTSPKVEILVVGGPDSAGGPDSTDDKVRLTNIEFSVFRRIDISKAAGLIHARTSLLADSSYAGEPGMSLWGSFTEVVRFADADGEVYVAITEPDGSIQIVSEVRSMPLIEKTADGWRQFIARNVAAARTKAATPPGPARTGPSE